MVDVVVPKAFTLTLDNHQPVKYPVGTYPMPVDHAEHWFARAHGVSIYEPVGAKKGG
jgi:hypothetical protein